MGDSDQSIYAFRGATIRNINDFESDFPGARVILLEQNYRSTQTILSAANAVIMRNENRKPKNLWSDAGDGEQLVGYVADTSTTRRSSWPQRSSGSMTRVDTGTATRRCSTEPTPNLEPSRKHSSESACRTRWSVAFGSTRREVRDAIAYLRAIANRSDDVSSAGS